jgi:hypothetical protein
LLSVVVKRLSHHAGLSLSSALGILSILSLVVCVPVFANGILSQVLQEQLAEKAARNQRALFSLHAYYPDNKDYTAINLENANQITHYINTYLENLMGLEVNEIVMLVTSSQYGWKPVSKSPDRHFKCSIWLTSSNILGVRSGWWRSMAAKLATFQALSGGCAGRFCR